MSGCCLLGHLGRCKRSVDWRDVSDVYLTKGPTQVIVETVGAGARSQSASLICAGGVSAVMGSSDFVALLSTRCGCFAISKREDNIRTSGLRMKSVTCAGAAVNREEGSREERLFSPMSAEVSLPPLTP